MLFYKLSETFSADIRSRVFEVLITLNTEYDIYRIHALQMKYINNNNKN